MWPIVNQPIKNIVLIFIPFNFQREADIFFKKNGQNVTGNFRVIVIVLAKEIFR